MKGFRFAKFYYERWQGARIQFALVRILNGERQGRTRSVFVSSLLCTDSSDKISLLPAQPTASEMTQLTGLNSITLNQDSVCPPLPDGRLRVYNMRFCPYAHRALLALSIKNIPAEVVNVNLKHKPAWFLEKNPLGKVPTLEKEGVVVFDSTICSEWLDEAIPWPKILPKDPLGKARQKMLVEQMSPIQPALFMLLRKRENAAQFANDALKVCEKLLKEDFYGGSCPGWADYMLWPFFERLEAVGMAIGAEMEVPWGQFPKLQEYKERMKGRREVQAVGKSPELHAEFMKSMDFDNPNYDATLP